MDNLHKISEEKLAKIISQSIEIIQEKYESINNIRITQMEIAKACEINHTRLSKAKNPLSVEVTSEEQIRIINSFHDNFGLRIDKVGQELSIDELLIKKIRANKNQYYIYYFINNRLTIEKAKLRTFLDSKRKPIAELTFFDQQTKNERAKYMGRVEEVSEQLFLIFDTRINILNNTEKFIPALNCYYGGWNALQNSLLIGTYTATGPTCGITVLEQSDSNSIEKAIQSNEVDNVIQSILTNRRIDVEKKVLKKNQNKYDVFHSALHDIEGNYEAYLLEGKKNREFIHKLKFKIDLNGKIKFISGISKEQNGIIVDNLHSIFVAQFDFKIKEGYYKIQIQIDSNPLVYDVIEGEKYLIGIYSGVDIDNTPMAGRILFKKSKQEFKDIEVKKFPLEGKNLIKGLFKNEPILYKFFRGELDSFVDSPIILEKHNLLFQQEPKSDDEIIKNLSGIYYIFHLSSDEKFIHKIPIEIYPSGKVTIWDIDKHGIGSKYLAYVNSFYGMYISIYTYKKNERDWFMHSLFSIGLKELNRVTHFFGVSNSLTNNANPRCSREIMVKFKTEVDKRQKLTNLYSERIPIPVLGVTSVEYEKLNTMFRGLATFLTGNANNLIKSKRDVDASFDRYEDYGYLYFSAACYQARNGESPKKVLKQLERAFLHGFKDKETLRKELINGMLSASEIKDKIDIDNLNLI